MAKYVDCYTVVAKELESITTNYSFESILRALLHGFALYELNGHSLTTM